MSRQFLHYDPDRVDFALSEHELDAIVNLSSNNWKDFSIGLLGFGLPCFINAWTAISAQHPFALTLTIFLNTVAGVVGLVLGGIFLIVWLRTRVRASDLLRQIKNKPRVELTAVTTAAGAKSTVSSSIVPGQAGAAS